MQNRNAPLQTNINAQTQTDTHTHIYIYTIACRYARSEGEGFSREKHALTRITTQVSNGLTTQPPHSALCTPETSEPRYTIQLRIVPRCRIGNVPSWPLSSRAYKFCAQAICLTTIPSSVNLKYMHRAWKFVLRPTTCLYQQHAPRNQKKLEPSQGQKDAHQSWRAASESCPEWYVRVTDPLHIYFSERHSMERRLLRIGFHGPCMQSHSFQT